MFWKPGSHRFYTLCCNGVTISIVAVDLHCKERKYSINIEVQKLMSFLSTGSVHGAYWTFEHVGVFGCLNTPKIHQSWLQMKIESIIDQPNVRLFCLLVYACNWSLLLSSFCRVLEQHKLSREQWEERIQVWHEEHGVTLKWACVYVKCWSLSYTHS